MQQTGPSPPGRPRRLLNAALLILAAALAFRAARAKAGYWNTDDAAITYVHAFALADHGSASAYAEGPSVEGYSNPLLYGLVAALRFVHLFDPIRTHLVVEAALFGLAVLCVFLTVAARAGQGAAGLAAAAFVLSELMTPATWAWYGSGLENALLTAGLAALLWRADVILRNGARPLVDGCLALAVALIRPEAVLYAAAFHIFLLATVLLRGRRSQAGHLRGIFGAMLVSLLLAATLLALRYAVYRDLLPNTYYAKITGTGFMAHLRPYVLPLMGGYHYTYAFAASTVVLLLLPAWRAPGFLLLLLWLGSTLLPGFKGSDWMGEHRFATALFATGHIAFGLLVGACYSSGGTAHARRAQLSAGALVVAAAVLLHLRGNPILSPPPLHPITIGEIAYEQGARRIDHQRRLGLINPTVILPDAGGSQLVGGFRMLDSGRLTDYQLAHLWGTRPRLPEINQYEHQEQRADLVDGNAIAFWSFDLAQIGWHFLRNPDLRMLPRRELVEVADLPAGLTPVIDQPDCRIYVSESTVWTAAPSGLVRVEVLVQRASAVGIRNIRATARLGDHDTDTARLVPYGDDLGPGIERRAFLLGAPAAAGRYDVTLTVQLPDGTTPQTVAIGVVEVLADPQRRAEAIRQRLTQPGVDARQQARLLATFREQSIERLRHRDWVAQADGLHLASLKRSAEQSVFLARLTWDARMASQQDVPHELDSLSATVIDAVLQDAGCEKRAPADTILCLGQTVDWLRGLGYFGVADRLDVRQQSAAVFARLDGADLPVRYRALVGLTLLWPADMTRQKELLALREQLSPLPVLRP